jgi:hypothetical protein
MMAKMNLQKHGHIKDRKSVGGKHTCHSIGVKSLKAFAEIPEDKKTIKINDYIEKGTDFILKHHILQAKVMI